jgi:hypothetical protein
MTQTLNRSNIVVQYYFDEAASGSGPPFEAGVNDILDHSGNGYHLTDVHFGSSGELTWTEVNGNRGLHSSSVTGKQRASRAIDNTSDAFRNALNGAQKLTIELVVDVNTIFVNYNSRIFCINGRTGNSPVVGLAADSNDVGNLYWNETRHFISAALSLSAGVRVIHIVYDTTVADQADRCLYYVDGGNVQQAGGASGEIPQNSTLAIGTDKDLIAFNRENVDTWDRSFEGTLFYAAIYNDAFDATRVGNHYQVLSLDNDATPSDSSAGFFFFMT